MYQTCFQNSSKDADINWQEGRELYFSDFEKNKSKGTEVVLAVLDTGVDLDHPDLKDSLWENPGELADNEKDEDGNGIEDDVHGADFVATSIFPRNSGAPTGIAK